MAVDHDVHVVGASSLAGGHRLLVPALIDALRQLGREDILVTVGGVVPPADVAALEGRGVFAVFGPGSPIPGCALAILEATVELTSPRRGDTQVSTTNDAGDFAFQNVLPDTYRLKLTMDSFKTVERENVVVNAADRQSVGTIVMEVGALTETVSVTSRVTEVQSRGAERSLAIDSTAISNLAVNGRSPLALVRIVPGISDAPADGSNLGFNVNGSRGGVHNLTVDGVSNMDTGNNGMSGNINLDAVEEFKILTNAYQAEYGRSSGAQISMITKSGGSRYTGRAYWYRRHEGMNANSWINNRNRGVALATDPNSTVGKKAISRQSDIGYFFGGPIPLGKLQQRPRPAVLLLRSGAPAALPTARRPAAGSCAHRSRT